MRSLVSCQPYQPTSSDRLIKENDSLSPEPEVKMGVGNSQDRHVVESLKTFSHLSPAPTNRLDSRAPLPITGIDHLSATVLPEIMPRAVAWHLNSKRARPRNPLTATHRIVSGRTRDQHIVAPAQCNFKPPP